MNAISPHSRTELEQYLNTLLQISKVKDYCPNGLQVAGKETITHIVTGVSATQALIDEAVEVGADAILVHHGYFWKNENPCVVGMKKQRLKTLLQHDINLFAYHLPLDVHETLGNNAQLANLLGVELIGGLDKEKAVSVPVYGQLASPMSLAEFSALVTLKLQRPPLVEAGSDKLIKTIGICTGGAQGYIELAAEQGLDAYLTGEVSEQTIHVAREMGIHFIAAGHHATERYGVKALGEHLQHQLGVQVTFIDIDNPA